LAMRNGEFYVAVAAAPINRRRPAAMVVPFCQGLPPLLRLPPFKGARAGVQARWRWLGQRNDLYRDRRGVNQ
jgi:hypothetical protein